MNGPEGMNLFEGAIRINRPFPSTSVRSNNSTGMRLGWTVSYISCIHPDLDMVLLFVRMRGMRERSIQFQHIKISGLTKKHSHFEV